MPPQFSYFEANKYDDFSAMSCDSRAKCGSQDALEVDSFSQSEEAFAAESLFDAYRTGSAEDIKRCISKRSIFTDLDNQVRLAANHASVMQAAVNKLCAGLLVIFCDALAGWYNHSGLLRC